MIRSILMWWVIFLLLTGTCPVSAQKVPGVTDLDLAIERAMGWVEAHPACESDGGPMDMIDEGVFYLVLQRMARTERERDRFAQRFRSVLSNLDASPAFEAWVGRADKGPLDHYHLVLAAHLMQIAGSPSRFQGTIVEAARDALEARPYVDPTLGLTIRAFLGYLDALSGSADKGRRNRSLIERIARSGDALPFDDAVPEPQRRRMEMLLYALVHEVVALTDFGHQPADPWLTQRRDALGRFLTRATIWASLGDNFDLLSELVVTLYLLDRPLHGPLDKAVGRLLAAQRADGTWGPCSAMRQNAERHAVQTAIAALWAYRGSLSASR